MKIARLKVFELIAKCRLMLVDQKKIEEFLDDYHYDASNMDDDLVKAISECYQGVSNGYLSEIYESIMGEIVEVIGEVSELYLCPCCKRKTLTECYDVDEGTGYDICPYCNWEDDGTKNIELSSGVNKGSIKEYRERIQQNPSYYFREKWL